MSRASKLLEKFELWEMSNLRQSETGLPMVIYISPKQGKHGPRVKVPLSHSHKFNPKEATVSVSIADEPQIVAGKALSSADFKWVKAYIRLNQQILLDFWDDKIGLMEFFSKQRKVTEADVL